MTVSLPVIKGGLKLGAAQVVQQVCSFLRSVIIARLISPENFGIAAVLAMTIYLLEMISNLGMEVLVIQAEEGNEPPFQKTVQLLQTCRGLINAILILALAGPMAQLFGVPQALWAFQCLALGPLIKGFTHLDPYRFQREMRFGPAVLVDISANVLSTLAALPLVWWLRDYSAMLWILVVQTAAAALGSHLVAERRYRWTWSPHYAKRIFSFGWPLMINGLLMYGIYQGDGFVIGSAHRLFPHSTYTLADLGVYSVAFSITMAPTMLIANLSTSLFLPLLSRAQGDRDQFERHYLACAQLVSLMAAMIAILFIIAGGWLVILIYGSNYAAAGGFIGWLAAMQALRIIRVAPTLASMARGDTRTVMLTNIVRSSALLGVLVVAETGLGLAWIAASGFVGEFIAMVVLIARLRRQHGIPAVLCLKPAGVVLAGMAMAAVTRGAANLGWVVTLLTSSALVMTMFLGIRYVFPELRRDVRAMVFKPQ